MGPGSDLEARSRLSSVLDVCEHEAARLERFEDPRLADVVKAMSTLRAEIMAALASFTQPPTEGAGFG
jgi:hypothetical protein